jgi:RimJ/RimL family protein N-acetyltransferase
MTEVFLQPWAENDLPLLEKLLGDPLMMAHLGGPESLEHIRERHQKYLALPETDHMFKIVIAQDWQGVGSIGFWERQWCGSQVYEAGWSILPEYHGRGIGTMAARLLVSQARVDKRFHYLHAFPSVDNPPSNAICQKLGFQLMDACEFEYPAGKFMLVNDWCLDLLG